MDSFLLTGGGFQLNSSCRPRENQVKMSGLARGSIRTPFVASIYREDLEI